MYDFSFLTPYGAQLAELASQAKAYVESDPSASLVKTRLFAESLARIVGEESKTERDNNETADEFLSRLSRLGHIPAPQLKQFHTIRMLGNLAAHENAGTRVQAVLALRDAHSLAVWFYERKSGKAYKAGNAKRSEPNPKSSAAELAEKIRKGQYMDPPTPKTPQPASQPLMLPRILKFVGAGAIMVALLIVGIAYFSDQPSREHTQATAASSETPLASSLPPAGEPASPTPPAITTDEACTVALTLAQSLRAIPQGVSFDGAKQQGDGTGYVCIGSNNPTYSIRFESTCSSAPTADCINVDNVTNVTSGSVLYTAPSPTASPTGESAPPADGGTTTMILGPENTKDIWTTSVYSYAPGGGGPGGGLDNDQLRIGGWGDWYWSLMRFDLSGEPTQAYRVILELYNDETDTTPTPFYIYVIDEDWGWSRGDRLWWANRPRQMHKASSVAAPSPDSWISIDITDIYNAWQSRQLSNFGIALIPQSNNNNFDRFRSSKYADESYRPRLVITPAQTVSAEAVNPPPQRRSVQNNDGDWNLVDH